jgi:hypothetical protein
MRLSLFQCERKESVMMKRKSPLLKDLPFRYVTEAEDSDAKDGFPLMAHPCYATVYIVGFQEQGSINASPATNVVRIFHVNEMEIKDLS